MARYITLANNPILNPKINEMGANKGGFIQGDQTDGAYEYADGSKISIYKDGKKIKKIEKSSPEYSKIKDDFSDGNYNKADYDKAEDSSVKIDKKLYIRIRTIKKWQ